jgi:hypothetical protein
MRLGLFTSPLREQVGAKRRVRGPLSGPAILSYRRTPVSSFLPDKPPQHSIPAFAGMTLRGEKSSENTSLFPEG